MPNIHDIESIKAAYTKESHFSYMRGDNNLAPLTAVVIVHSQADEDGDFSLEHGYRQPRNEFSRGVRLPVQGEYNDMVRWIQLAAEEGEA